MAASKGSKKAVKNVLADCKKKRKARRNKSFSIYMYNVLKQVHYDTGISSNAIVCDEFTYTGHAKRKTVSALYVEASRTYYVRIRMLNN